MGVKYSETRFSWLESYLANEEEICSLELNLSRTKIELRRWLDGDLSHVRIEKRSHGANVENVIEQTEALLAEDYALRERTLDLIEHFNGIENQILKYKYVKGMSLLEISDMDGIGYSYSTIKRIHAELKHTLHFLDAWDKPEPRQKSTKKV